jgi:hypothetical protein
VNVFEMYVGLCTLDQVVNYGKGMQLDLALQTRSSRATLSFVMDSVPRLPRHQDKPGSQGDRILSCFNPLVLLFETLQSCFIIHVRQGSLFGGFFVSFAQSSVFWLDSILLGGCTCCNCVALFAGFVNHCHVYFAIITSAKVFK